MVTDEQLDEAAFRLARRLAVVVYMADFEVYAHLPTRRHAMAHSREALRRFGYSRDEIDALDALLEERHDQVP